MPRLTIGKYVAVGLTLVAAGALTTTGAAQTSARGRALAIEDYYRIQTVASPAISPDGRWVSLTVSTRIEDDNSTRTETFVVRSDASARPARVVHYGKDVTSPAWTADSRLEYTAERQHWTIDPATPSAAPVKAATLPAGAVFSVDRKSIAFAKEKAQPKKDRQYASDFEKRHEERFKGVTFDWKDFQRDGQPFPAPNLHARPAAQLVVQSVPTGSGLSRTPQADAVSPAVPVASGFSRTSQAGEQVLVDLDLRPGDIAWHPGGNLLAFTADPDWRDELKYGNNQLFTVSTAGAVTRLATDGYVYSDVDFSPDGKYLSFARTFGTEMIVKEKLTHGGPRDLFIRAVDGGQLTNLTANWDLEPSDARWSPDGRFVYFNAEIGGETQLFRVSVTDAVRGEGAPGVNVVQITKGPRRLGNVTIDKAFKTIAYSVGLHDAPPDIYAANIDGTNERRLSDVHSRVTAEIALSKADRLQWPSTDGTAIEGWLMFPYGYDAAKGPYPLIVMSHGGPHSATGYSFD